VWSKFNVNNLLHERNHVSVLPTTIKGIPEETIVVYRRNIIKNKGDKR
jgi:hypothetical protein